MASGAYARALPSLRIATRVAPDDATLWYNLACCEARMGRSAEALASLERALDLGFPRPTQIESDPDLASLRGQAAFARLVERARAAERP
jgi:Tfp pilus assembly protein PilF